MYQPFKFKQFEVKQDRCAMKIGTDSVLLAAWSSLEHNPKTILDIGAGTGVLSLMLAQRSSAEIIDAIEIDDAAYEQCVENFENSVWADRLFCYHASLEEFVDEIEDKYDLIISNPPYFEGITDTINKDARAKARFNEFMPFDHLCGSVSKLLEKEGKFVVVLPYRSESKFIEIAAHFKLHPHRVLHVKGNNVSTIKRSLIEFSFQTKDLQIETLIIEVNRHEYTPEYIALTKDFYLKM